MIRWKREGTIVKFCDRLLQLRRARKLTQKDVAAACGITRQTYSGYESGERYPKKKEMYQVLADFFEVDVAYLCTDREMFLDAAHEQYGSRGMAQALMEGWCRAVTKISIKGPCSPRPYAASWSPCGQLTPSAASRRWACGQRVCQYRPAEKRKPARWRASRSST